MNSFSEAWLRLLHEVRWTGRDVAPRGKPTKELPMHTVCVDMRRPVLLVPERKLSYQFMAAEAYWMLMGDDTVAGIAPWNKNISQFSDDGVRFFGAYGPKILDQLDYVVHKLCEDHDSRQAGLTIWRERPPKTKDVPCTVAMFFSIRASRLEMNVFMRSNDVWLGTPYDVFNFSMVAHLVCCRLNQVNWLPGSDVSPGDLRLTAASSHLYDVHWEAAAALAPGPTSSQFVGGVRELGDLGETLRPLQLRQWLAEPETPEELWLDTVHLRRTLKNLRDSKPGDALRWWEVKP